MTNVEIDLETGMPKLPEGMFWRVFDVMKDIKPHSRIGYSSGEVVYYHYDGTTTRISPKYTKKSEGDLDVYVRLMKKTVVPDRYEDITKGYLWWERTEKVLLKPEHEIEETLYELPIHAGEKITDMNVVLHHLSHGTPAGWEVRQSPPGSRYEYPFSKYLFRHLPLSEKLVRRTARQVWEDYINTEHAKAMIERDQRNLAALKEESDKIKENLLGDYPPKRLA